MFENGGYYYPVVDHRDRIVRLNNALRVLATEVFSDCNTDYLREKLLQHQHSLVEEVTDELLLEERWPERTYSEHGLTLSRQNFHTDRKGGARQLGELLSAQCTLTDTCTFAPPVRFHSERRFVVSIRRGTTCTPGGKGCRPLLSLDDAVPK